MLDIPTESVKYTPAKSLEVLLQGDRNIHTLYMWSVALVTFLEYNTVASRPLEYTIIYDIQPGSSIRFHSHRRSCNQPGYDSYTLCYSKIILDN